MTSIPLRTTHAFQLVLSPGLCRAVGVAAVVVACLWGRGAVASEPLSEAEVELGAPISTLEYGETLTYRINVLLGEIARCALQTGYVGEDANLGAVVPLRGLCTTIGMMSALYSFEYSGHTFVDAASHEPVWSEKVLDDRGRLRSYETVYEREAYHADVVRREDDRATPREASVPSDVLDILSWVQAVRSSDMRVGAISTHYIYDGWKIRRLVLTVKKHVEFAVDGEDEPVLAAEFDVDAQTLGSAPIVPWLPESSPLPPAYFNLGETDTDVGRAWFSLDERRYPLGVDVGTPFGSMRIRLRELPRTQD